MKTNIELFVQIINDKESKNLYRKYMFGGSNRLDYKRSYEERKLYIFNLINYLGINKRNQHWNEHGKPTNKALLK